MARFFIDRPIFAWVIAIIIMLAGALSIFKLPISMYPEVAPPSVAINASYPGASAAVVENSVTQIIEQNMKGLDGLMYFSSNSSSSGQASITLTFESGTDPDIAQVQVQNKLQLATPLLPQEVQRQGISVSKSSSSFLQVVGFVSEDGSMDENDVADYVSSNIVDPISRVAGVGSVMVFGGKYAMRIWLDPNKLQSYKVSVSEVSAAVRAQNAQVAVGQLGGAPAVKGQQLNATISAQERLQTAEQFRNIVIRTEADGSTLKLGDVARVELGAESYENVTRFNGKPATGVAITLATGANALDAAEGVRAALDELKRDFPAGMTAVIPYDTTPFVKVSIKGVIETLIEAIVLVFLVMYLFLQNFRATLIPTIAVPVVLLGTFGILAALGFSINMLTMFAMVLAIGLLVDDAIVVVENVERIMSEEGLSPLEATRKSMGQITGALVGVALVLAAVFVPMAFFSGSTGVIYRQFSITIITAMILSLGVAVILTPAMCASLLKARKHGEGGIAPARWFNRNLDRVNTGYVAAVTRLVKRPLRMLLVLVAIGFGVMTLFDRLPGSFLPDEDQGVALAIIQGPDGSTTQQTEALVEKVEEYLLTQETDTVESVFAALGFSFAGTGQSNALVFIKLRDYDDRKGFDIASLVGRANGYFFGTNRQGQIFALQPPAIQGLGTSSGFTMYMVDQSGQGQDALAAAANQLVADAQAGGQVTNLRGNETANTQTALRLDIDQQKAAAFGLEIGDVNAMLSVIFAGRDVNDFALGNDLRPVVVQGEAESRSQPQDIERWYARNSQGEMVSFGAFADQSWQQEPQSLARFGGTRALELSGAAVPGLSSGEAMDVMEQMVADMDGGYGTAWTGLSFQERLSGNQAPLLFALSALVVFLSLAALYESWSVPLAVMLTVPVGILGALAAALFFGQSNDVYFKVGLLTTIGLAARNAILIVEFAEAQVKEGKSVVEAALIASRQRLRPILMTTFAFMLGVLPLAIASGAGAGAQNSIGIGVLGGMASSAVIGIFLVPVFYVAVLKIRSLLSRKKEKTS